MAKVTITPKGKVIRGSDNRTEESDEQVEPKAMWDFKLKKTRIIFVISIIWFFTSYFFTGTTDTYGDWSIDYVMTHPLLYIMLTPLFIYWIVIPSYRWIMKGK
jgi:hypothetical protein